MTSRPTFTITCERCGRQDHERAYFTQGEYGFNEAGKFVALPEILHMSFEEAHENADLTFLMKGWAVADFGKTKKGKVDLCPDCLKQWEELGDDYVLEPDEDSEKIGYMLEFRYKGEKE